MPDTEMPFIPEFRQATDRNRWIKEHATLFTVIRRKNRSYQREECPTYEEATALAKKLVERDRDARLLVYAIWNQSDALVATVSQNGVAEHT